MITLPQSLKIHSARTLGPRTKPDRPLPQHEAPSVAPGGKVIEHVECDGEPPLEALRNSGMC